MRIASAGRNGASAASAAVAFWAAAIVAAVVPAGVAAAAPIYGTPAPNLGTRVVGTPGLQTADPDWLDAQVDWSITPNGDGTLTYRYTFRNFNKPAISHVTLDLSDDAVSGKSLADPKAVTDFRVNGLAASKLEFGNHDDIVGAVKLDKTDPETTPNLVTYSFVSNRQPVWGDVHVKAGSASVLRNTGFGDQLVSANPLDYVARPNGATVGVPEPGSLGILVAAGLMLRRRRRRAPHSR